MLDLPEIIGRLRDHVLALHFRWQRFLSIYGRPDRLRLANDVAGPFFAEIQRSWALEMYLGICRLGDPAHTNRRENLTFQLVLCRVRAARWNAGENSDAANYERLETLQEALEDLLSQFNLASDPVRTLRNRLLAHTDREADRAEAVPSVTRNQIQACLGLIREMYNCAASVFGEGAMTWHWPGETDDAVDSPDILNLLRCIAEGRAIRESRHRRRDEALRGGHDAMRAVARQLHEEQQAADAVLAEWDLSKRRRS